MIKLITNRTRRWSIQFILLFAILAILTACRLDMRTQPRLESFEESSFFADGAVVRPLIADTVARGQRKDDEQVNTGRINGRIVDSFPFTPTLELIERGHERYDIFCTPCHGLTGDGQGIITQYGMDAPISFHDPALRDEATGYYFTIITNGTRVMPSYAARIPVEDRWAIIAYIRALQLSQNVDRSQLTPDELPQLDKTEVITQ